MSTEEEALVLLHGLVRAPRSMARMAAAARDQGYTVFNLGYPSRTATIEQLAEACLVPVVSRAMAQGFARIHFVTHSMGGILVRQYLSKRRPSSLGRVVMLGPPNRGSELVDRLGAWAPFGWINGPAGLQPGTGAQGLCNRLGPVDYPVGVIAGTRSYNPLYSALIAGPSDGKVSVERARLDGMADFLVLPVNHTFMMRDRMVVRQALHFLQHGVFEGDAMSNVTPV